MPPYDPILEKAVGTLIAAADLNKIGTNLVALNETPHVIKHHPGTGSNYTRVGGGVNKSYGPIDTTELKGTITTKGGLIIALFTCVAQSSIFQTQGIFSVIRMVNNELVVANSDYAGIQITTKDNPVTHTGLQLFENLPAGAYDFAAAWANIASSGTCTIFVAHRPMLALWEI